MAATDLSARYVFAATAVVTSDVLRETFQYTNTYNNIAKPLRINSSQEFTLYNDIKYKLY